MARFVLVHGGFSGAWIWLPLMDSLKSAGHSVEALDLPGMGDDHTSASEVSLDSYAARVCEVLAADSEPAVVVGHSMDRAIPLPLRRRMVAENMCAGVIELDTDHTPQLSMTNELAKALHRFATHSSAVQVSSKPLRWS